MESMMDFKMLVNNILMKAMSIYINFILFIKEEMTIFSVGSFVDSNTSSKEPTLDLNLDFIEIEVSSLEDEPKYNPSTGYLMVGMVDVAGNAYGCSQTSSGFGHSDSF